MLARALRIQLAAELILYGVLASWLARARDWHWIWVVALVAAAFLLVRAAAISLTFGYAWTYRTPRETAQRIGPPAALRLWFSELRAFVVLFALVQPFERLFAFPNPRQPPPPGEIPVLLVHGYQCNRAVWRRLQRRLARAGFPAFSTDLGPPLASIDAHAECLRRRVHEVLEASGAQRLILVAHSMGGLAARAYLAAHGARCVARLVTLGTPHAGSQIARIGPGRCAREMIPGSAWLRELAAREEGAPCATTSIYSCHDNFVMPQANQRLPWAENIALPGLGHLSMLDDPGLLERLVEILRRSATST